MSRTPGLIFMFMSDIHTDAQIIRVPEGWHYCFVLYHDICPQTTYMKQYTHYSFSTILGDGCGTYGICCRALQQIRKNFPHFQLIITFFLKPILTLLQKGPLIALVLKCTLWASGCQDTQPSQPGSQWIINVQGSYSTTLPPNSTRKLCILHLWLPPSSWNISILKSTFWVY